MSKRNMMVLQVYWQVGKVSGAPRLPQTLRRHMSVRGWELVVCRARDRAVRANMQFSFHHFIRPQAVPMMVVVRFLPMVCTDLSPLSLGLPAPCALTLLTSSTTSSSPSVHLPWRCLSPRAVGEIRYWFSPVCWYRADKSGPVSARPPERAGTTKRSVAVIGRGWGEVRLAVSGGLGEPPGGRPPPPCCVESGFRRCASAGCRY